MLKFRKPKPNPVASKVIIWKLKPKPVTSGPEKWKPKPLALGFEAEAKHEDGAKAH